ncbi:MAG: FliM/FliN family flagellar motor switch protein, partial [Deltaproteobacteria bacterium]|nr:FliM/FliN family flagellar motor switch protein [Deltaproteobacteria bacterium]
GAGSLDLGALEPESVEPALDEDSLDLSTVPKRGAAGAGEDEVLDLDEVPMAPEATGEALDFSETDTDGSLNLPEGGDELELPELVDMAEPAQSAEAEKEVRLEGFEALDEEPGLPGEGDSTIQFDTLDELSEEPAAPTKSGEFFAVPDVNLDDVSLEDLVSGSAAAAAAAQPKPAAPPRQTKAPGQAKAAEEDVLELSSAQAVSAPPALKSPLGLERELLLSVPRKVNVEMGSVSLSGSEIMELSYGSIVQLEQTVGEPVELVLEGRIIARGEVVVINGRALGVRILQLQK